MCTVYQKPENHSSLKIYTIYPAVTEHVGQTDPHPCMLSGVHLVCQHLIHLDNQVCVHSLVWACYHLVECQHLACVEWLQIPVGDTKRHDLADVVIGGVSRAGVKLQHLS